ncbi:MAG: hypothetical protein CFE21_12935 [Bacteroidetes bacterium B1(2017)]|nr:MAG: hypothetical protein CFE21_12935 [Bacteroidetes bacterium B1(2017)]
MKLTSTLLLALFLLVVNQCSLFHEPINSHSGIYSANKKWTFLATFNDSNEIVTSQDTLILKTEDEAFMAAQNKIVWTLIHTYSPAPNQTSVETTDNVTGLVDTEQELWLHPPRFKGYEEYTELAPFPKIKYPLQIGATWKDKFNLGTHSSEERGSEVEYSYTLRQIDTIGSNPIQVNYLVEGIGVSKAGRYTSKAWFNQKLGFTKFEYRTPLNNCLTISIVQ